MNLDLDDGPLARSLSALSLTSAFPSAKIKVEELFLLWLSSSEGTGSVLSLVEGIENGSVGRGVDNTSSSSSRASTSGSSSSSSSSSSNGGGGSRGASTTAAGHDGGELHRPSAFLSGLGSNNNGTAGPLMGGASQSHDGPPRSPTKKSPKKRTQSEMLSRPGQADASSVSLLDHGSGGGGGGNGGSSMDGGGGKGAPSLSSSSSAGRAPAALGAGVGAAGNGNGNGSNGASPSRLERDREGKEGDSSDSHQAARRRNNLDVLPQFYFPRGPNAPPHTRSRGAFCNPAEDALEARMGEIREYFKVYPAGIPHDRFVHVTKKLVGLPSFFNAPLVARINALYGTASDAAAAAAGGGRTRGGALLSAAAPATTGAGSSSASTVTLASFVQYWKNEVSPFDRVTRFFRAVKRPEAECVTKDDLIPFLQELLHYHPGLEFLEGSDEFQLKYALSVVARIFFQVNRSGSGRLSLSEVCRSNLYAAFMHVDEENDINRVTEYFSYEHFYVLYCRFFELDADRNGLLSREDLIRYSEHALSEQIVDRVFQEGRRAFSDGQRGFADVPGMGFGDFCFFMLSEEDKTSEASLRYWFHCCDLDGDGVLSTEELRHFYRGQLHRMSSLGVECVPFQDVLCQLLDLIDPADSQALTLRDLLRADKRMQSGLLFDVLFNLNKFLRFEQRDPFQEKLRREDGFSSDWDRFAFLDYQRLSSEDQGSGGSARLDGDMEIDMGMGHGDGGYGRGGGGQSYMQQQVDAGATLGGRSQWLDDSDEDEDDGFGDGGAGGGGVQQVYLARGGLAGRGRR